jgi:PAS domain S-box-containing protein
MIQTLLESHIAIVGGGKFCKAFLQFLFDQRLACRRPEIVGVADKDTSAPGFQLARQLGIPTAGNYEEFYTLPELDVILELTSDRSLGEAIQRNCPDGVRVIDHLQARAFWDFLQLEDLRQSSRRELLRSLDHPDAVVDIFDRITDHFADILRRRNTRAHEIELELVENERIRSQIIQGSTIPTFVIDRDHRITHWNRAMENLTGIPAENIIGSNRQWIPFYERERPTMADVILDQTEETDIKKLYGNKWHKSQLIEGGYEAEAFFPKLGKDGAWCWFTAAPIKSPDGSLVGAIETLWDKTEDKKAEEERERHTQELASLVAIYSCLSAPVNLNQRINSTVEEIKKFLSAESICIFLLVENELFHLKYSYGLSEALCKRSLMANENGIVRRVMKQDQATVFENLPENESREEIGLSREEGLKSLAYIPISAKRKRTYGVIRVGSRTQGRISPEDRRVLELIGNRIGVAIENAMLQEQYIKSEEKYRSLFNNDPNPIFILDSDSFKILDTNERAQDCYGYDREELFGMPFVKLGDPHDEEVETGLKSLSAGQSLLFSKKKHYKKGKRSFYVNINISQAKYGEWDVIIATTTDITESIEREIQLIQAGKMTTLGVMAAGMAHEINQPLNVIQICTDYLQKSIQKGRAPGAEELTTLSGDIAANVQRITGVIKHVRDFARQSEIVRSKVLLNDPIQAVFNVLGHQIKAHEIDLNLDLAEDLPYVMAEHNRLEQVFINLVSNAIDAIDEKRRNPEISNPETRIDIRTFSRDGRVVAQVSDTGIGMDQEVMDKILEPFFTTKEVGKGTGLGVSISYGIIKDYDGAIDIDSRVGRGTTFTLSFPAVS